jgi:hypothetical protein
MPPGAHQGPSSTIHFRDQGSSLSSLQRLSPLLGTSKVPRVECVTQRNILPMHRVSFLAAYAVTWLASRSWLLCFLAVTWALATALSRTLMGRHYLSDVAAGLALGLVTALLVTQVRAASPAPAHARTCIHRFAARHTAMPGSTCKCRLQNRRGHCTQWAAGSRGRPRRARMQGQCRRWRAGCPAWTSVRWAEAVCSDMLCLARHACCNTALCSLSALPLPASACAALAGDGRPATQQPGPVPGRRP